MRNAYRLIAVLFGLFAVCNVSGAMEEPVTEKTFHYNFANGSSGWSADFAEYPAGQEEFYELGYNFARLPRYLATDRFALQLVGNNHSDDLCMFLRRKVTGLKPNTDYQVSFKISISSNAPKGSTGVGGAPGESVFVKAGVSRLRPAADPNSRLLNIDKGNQAVDGIDAIALGHIGVSTPVEAPKYCFKVLRNNNKPFRFRTGNSGEAWLFFATDSGFEGTSRVYVVAYTAVFVEM